MELEGGFGTHSAERDGCGRWMMGLHKGEVVLRWYAVELTWKTESSRARAGSAPRVEDKVTRRKLLSA